MQGIAGTLLDGADLGFGINYGWCIIQRFEDVALWGTVEIDADEIRSFLMAHAIASLPAGTRYELRAKYPDNHGRSFGMAWYRHPRFDRCHTWGYTPEKVEPREDEGYLLVGEYVTPDVFQLGGAK